MAKCLLLSTLRRDADSNGVRMRRVKIRVRRIGILLYNTFTYTYIITYGIRINTDTHTYIPIAIKRNVNEPTIST